jgi:hypothetical protein
MREDAVLACRCGEVQGLLKDAAPEKVNRIICYCADCQAFAHHLGRVDLLDRHGGTDIVQVAPAALSFSKGAARIRGLRLTPKGLYRWYAGCCHTPVGNTVGPKLPFVGIVARVFEGSDGGPDALFGRPIGAIFGKYAVGEAPPGSDSVNLRLLLRAVRLVVGWRLFGRTWPHPFFARANGAPLPPLEILTTAQREALRPLCGPRPAASR